MFVVECHLELEGLLGAAKLFSVAGQAKAFSSEMALQLLYSHSFDVLAATQRMANAIGVHKVLDAVLSEEELHQMTDGWWR